MMPGHIGGKRWITEIIVAQGSGGRETVFGPGQRNFRMQDTRVPATRKEGRMISTIQVVIRTEAVREQYL